MAGVSTGVEQNPVRSDVEATVTWYPSLCDRQNVASDVIECERKFQLTSRGGERPSVEGRDGDDVAVMGGHIDYRGAQTLTVAETPGGWETVRETDRSTPLVYPGIGNR